jgi:NTP pyrophosphatase (non-canonical NTP hydrolase)
VEKSYDENGETYILSLDFFEEYAKIQKLRSKRVYKGVRHTETLLGCALGEECGELLGYIKKEIRDKKDYTKNKKKEVADIFSYLVMYCHLKKFDMGKIIVDKFNEVSRRKKCKIKIKAKK